VLSKRSINQVDDRQPISKLGTQLSVWKRRNSKHPSVFSFNLLMCTLVFPFIFSYTSYPKYLVELLPKQILVLKREEDGLPNYK
jgi:hypothetical protein